MTSPKPGRWWTANERREKPPTSRRLSRATLSTGLFCLAPPLPPPSPRFSFWSESTPSRRRWHIRHFATAPPCACPFHRPFCRRALRVCVCVCVRTRRRASPLPLPLPPLTARTSSCALKRTRRSYGRPRVSSKSVVSIGSAWHIDLFRSLPGRPSLSVVKHQLPLSWPTDSSEFPSAAASTAHQTGSSPTHSLLRPAAALNRPDPSLLQDVVQSGPSLQVSPRLRHSPEEGPVLWQCPCFQVFVGLHVLCRQPQVLGHHRRVGWRRCLHRPAPF